MFYFYDQRWQKALRTRTFVGENLVKHHFNVRARPLLANMQLGVRGMGLGTGKGGLAINVDGCH